MAVKEETRSSLTKDLISAINETTRIRSELSDCKIDNAMLAITIDDLKAELNEKDAKILQLEAEVIGWKAKAEGKYL